MIEGVDASDLAGGRAVRELAERLRPFVAKRVREVDVDDVLQEIFLRIQGALPTLRDEQRLGPWLYLVARSVIIDHLRRTARQPQASERAWELMPDDGEEGESAVEREVAGYAAMFVAFLPSPYREALTLTELSGLTQQEAADMLGISLSAMKSRVQRGRKKLREALEACCHIALDARRRVVACEPRPDGKLPDGCCDP